MKIFHFQEKLKKYLLDKKNIGFVPTMGALHKGHLSLIKAATKENNIVIVSIFVNPLQFDNAADLKNYPRNLEKDFEFLKKYNENIIIYNPNVDDIYSKNIPTKKYDFEGIDCFMEGKYRKNHFQGVATVVELLLKIVKADKVYFGEKDFQQLQIVKKLVANSNIRTQVIACPTIREKSGLAISSRNERLSSKEKKESEIVFRSLQLAKELKNKYPYSVIKNKIENLYAQKKNLELEYFCIVNKNTLKEITQFKPESCYRAFIAVKVSKIRLIDNISI